MGVRQRLDTGPENIIIEQFGEHFGLVGLGQILEAKPRPEQRPRWDRVRQFAEDRYGRTARALFFLNANRGLPGTFIQALRLAGLTLFVVVAAKVFFSDLAHLHQLYRIVAFLALGALLLAGSFVYLRFRQRFTVSTEESAP